MDEEERIFEEDIEKMTRDLAQSGADVGRDEARFLVSQYYNMQNQRIRFNNQKIQLHKEEEPNELITHFRKNFDVLEKQVQSTLRYYSRGDPVGRWLLSICGIGDVISAGLLSHIDIEKVNYAGQIWSFAGLSPNQKEWTKGTKRPFNAELKKLCYKIGESFVKVQNNDKDVYGTMFVNRKADEWEKNLNGEYSEIATQKLANINIGKGTNAYKWYSGQVDMNWIKELRENNESFPESIPKKALIVNGIPMLPPAHIHARARRYAVKIFLSHLFEVMFMNYHHARPPKPYIIQHGGHSRYMPPPNLDEWLEAEHIHLPGNYIMEN